MTLCALVLMHLFLSFFIICRESQVSRALNRALNGVVVRPPNLSAVASSSAPGASLPVSSPVSTAATDPASSAFAPDNDAAGRAADALSAAMAGSPSLDVRPSSPPSSPLSTRHGASSSRTDGRLPVGGTSRVENSAQRPLPSGDRFASLNSAASSSGGGLVSGDLSLASMDAGLSKGSGSSLGNLISPDAMWRQSASSAGAVPRETTPSRSSSARSTVATIRRGLFGSIGGGGSSSPSVTPTDGASAGGAGGADSSARAKWRREAWAGWLDNSTLSLAAMPKDFVVDSSDPAISTGLRLFPCRARSETSVALTRGRSKVGGSNAGGAGTSAADASSAASGEFKRRFLGVSTRYIMLLSPHGLRSHLLKVKLIRHLHDIVRITFKRSRPELVTFELLSATDPSAPNEQVVCIMPDGLSDCVELIKDALADSDSVQPTTASMAGTPLAGMGHGSPSTQSVPVAGAISPTAAVEAAAAGAAAVVIGAGGDVGVGKASGPGIQAPFGLDNSNSGTWDAEAQVPQPPARNVVQRLDAEPAPP